MGVLKGFGLVIVCVIMFVLLISAGIFATFNKSLTYENVQPRVYNIANDIITIQIGSQEILNQFAPYLLTICRNESEIVQKIQNYTFVIPCSIVSEGQNSLINYTVDYLVKDFYYKEYNCTFVKCFQESSVPLFLVSNHAREYWRSLLYKTILGIIISFGLLFLLTEKKSNTLTITGSLMVVSSLVILQLNKIGTFIAKSILTPISTALKGTSVTKDIISQIVGLFFSESSKVFLWMFIAGLILIALGLVLRLTGWGMKIKEKIETLTTRSKVEQLEEKTKSLEKQLQQKNSSQQSSQNQNNNQKNNKPQQKNQNQQNQNPNKNQKNNSNLNKNTKK